MNILMSILPSSESHAIMSLTLTLTGKNSVLSVRYFPPIDISDGDYELGLIDFETFNTIPNINLKNNKFYFGNADEEITIPEGSYELDAINAYLQREIVKRHPYKNKKDNVSDEDLRKKKKRKNAKDGDGDDNDEAYNINEHPIILRANNNTMKSEIFCSFRVNFTKECNVGSLLGFSRDRILSPGEWYESDQPVNIISINMLRIECNMTGGSYNNSKPVHTIHEFSTRVPPGYKISETPSRVIYLPIVGRVIDNLTIRIVDQNGLPVDFRGEEITARLHVRRLHRHSYDE